MNIMILGFLLCVVLFLFSRFAFSKGGFWKELMAVYGCSEEEFKSKKALEKPSRLVFFEDGRWTSTNIIDIKLDDSNIYFGVDFPFEFFIKPIKIPKSKLIFIGTKNYAFKKRISFEIPIPGSSSKQVALLEYIAKCSGTLNLAT